MLSSGGRDVCKCLDRISNVLLAAVDFSLTIFYARIRVAESICKEFGYPIVINGEGSFGDGNEYKVTFENQKTCLINWSTSKYLIISRSGYADFVTNDVVDFDRIFRNICTQNRNPPPPPSQYQKTQSQRQRS